MLLYASNSHGPPKTHNLHVSHSFGQFTESPYVRRWCCWCCCCGCVQQTKYLIICCLRMRFGIECQWTLGSGITRVSLNSYSLIRPTLRVWRLCGACMVCMYVYRWMWWWRVGFVQAGMRQMIIRVIQTRVVWETRAHTNNDRSIKYEMANICTRSPHLPGELRLRTLYIP